MTELPVTECRGWLVKVTGCRGEEQRAVHHGVHGGAALHGGQQSMKARSLKNKYKKYEALSVVKYLLMAHKKASGIAGFLLAQ